MFCNKCSEKIPDDSLFCPKCGQKIEKIEEDTPRVKEGKEIAKKWNALNSNVLRNYELVLEANGLHSKGDNCFVVTEDIDYTYNLGLKPKENDYYSLGERYVINERKDDIVIVTCDRNSLEPLCYAAWIVPKSEITKIEIYGRSNPRMRIFRKDKKMLDVIFVNVVSLKDERQRQMVRNFVMDFPNEGIEILSEERMTKANSRRSVFFVLLMLVLFALAIVVCIANIGLGIFFILLLILIIYTNMRAQLDYDVSKQKEKEEQQKEDKGE